MLKFKSYTLSLLLILFLSIFDLCYSSRNAGDDDVIRRKAKKVIKSSRLSNEQTIGKIEEMSEKDSKAESSTKYLHEQINIIFDELAKHKTEMETLKAKYEDELFNKESSWKAMLEGIHTPEQQNATLENIKLKQCKVDILTQQNFQNSQSNHASLEISAAQAKVKREEDMILTKIADLQTSTDKIYNYNQLNILNPKEITNLNKENIKKLNKYALQLESEIKSLHNEKDDRIYIIDMNHYKSKIWTYGCISSFIMINLFFIYLFVTSNLTLGNITNRIPIYISKPLKILPYFLSSWMFLLIILSFYLARDPLDSMSSFYNMNIIKGKPDEFEDTNHHARLSLNGHERYKHDIETNEDEKTLISKLWWSDVNTSIQSEFCLFFTSYLFLLISSLILIGFKLQNVMNYQLTLSIRLTQFIIIMIMMIISTFYIKHKSFLMESTNEINLEITSVLSMSGRINEEKEGEEEGNVNDVRDDMVSDQSETLTGIKPALNYLSMGLAFMLLGYLEHLISTTNQMSNERKTALRFKKTFSGEDEVVLEVITKRTDTMSPRKGKTKENNQQFMEH